MGRPTLGTFILVLCVIGVKGQRFREDGKCGKFFNVLDFGISFESTKIRSALKLTLCLERYNFLAIYL